MIRDGNPGLGPGGAPVRVRLRRIARSDQAEFIRLARASAELLHPWIWLPETAAGFQEYVARFDHSYAEGLLVCLAETGAIAGQININNIVRGNFQCGALGYAAFAPTAGRGYMSEGLALVLRLAFGELGLHRLEANIQPGNAASIRLVRRHGFRREGLSPAYLRIGGHWRDHERWAITTEMMVGAAPV